MKKQEFIFLLNELVNEYHSTKDLSIRIDIAEKHTDLLKSNVHLLEDDISNGIPDYEVWKNAIGYEGIYQISNLGNVKSLERFFIKSCKKWNDFKQAVYMPQKIRNRRINPNGYITASFWMMGKPKHVLLHRLVAILFIPNPNNFPQVLHKDDNPQNPRWDNLEWGTQSKNIQDAADRGRGFRGSKNGMAKLKESDIPIIRELLKQKIPTRKIGQMFNVAKSQIQGINHNRIWKHVK